METQKDGWGREKIPINPNPKRKRAEIRQRGENTLKNQNIFLTRRCFKEVRKRRKWKMETENTRQSRTKRRSRKPHRFVLLCCLRWQTIFNT